jgi:hypothetical protein
VDHSTYLEGHSRVSRHRCFLLMARSRFEKFLN